MYAIVGRMLAKIRKDKLLQEEDKMKIDVVDDAIRKELDKIKLQGDYNDEQKVLNRLIDMAKSNGKFYPYMEKDLGIYYENYKPSEDINGIMREMYFYFKNSIPEEKLSFMRKYFDEPIAKNWKVDVCALLEEALICEIDGEYFFDLENRYPMSNLLIVSYISGLACTSIFTYLGCLSKLYSLFSYGDEKYKEGFEKIRDSLESTKVLSLKLYDISKTRLPFADRISELEKMSDDELYKEFLKFKSV